MSTLNELGDRSAMKLAPEGAGTQLKGNLSTTEIVFSVLAFNAPLSAFIGWISIVIAFGNGQGAPITYLVAGVLVMLFAVGFTAMSRRMPNPGGFYSYITAGLGREVGLGASFLALFSYITILLCMYAFGGLALSTLVRDVFSGPDIAWWVYGLAMQAVVAVLGYVKIDLSAKVLTVLMCGEVLVVAAYQGAILIKGGPEGYQTGTFDLDAMLSGSIGIALLFALTTFSGFESAAIYREEARDPERTIPRAIYLSVGLLAVTYAIGAYIMLVGLGPSQAVALTSADPTGSVTANIQTYLGVVGRDIASLLLVTSIFASTLAIHNVSTRYFYSLSMDKIISKRLSGVHRRHKSPYIASTSTSILSVALTLVLVVLGLPGETLYAFMGGIGGIALQGLLMLTSAAVVGYFLRPLPSGETVSVWVRVVAPGIAAVAFSGAIYLAVTNVTFLTGQPEAVSYLSLILGAALFAGGIIYALYLRKKRPETYLRIGRQTH
jgi:amino acid transporter